MAELVDALDSGSSRGNSVEVRLFLAALLIDEKKNIGCCQRRTSLATSSA
jgi:hypothetical protein